MLFSNSGYTYAQSLEDANKDYFNQQYEQSITKLQSILKQSPYSSSLHYNLAANYYRLGKYGMSLAHLDIASRLTPRDKDIRQTRNFIQNKINPIFIQNQQDKLFNSAFFWIHFLSLNELMLIFGLLGTSFWIYLIVLIFKNKQGKSKVSLLVIILFLTYMFSGLSYSYKINHSHAYARVTSNNASVYPSFLDQQNPLTELKDGTKVQILGQHQLKDGTKWFQIYLSKEKNGWISKDFVKVY